MNVMVNGWTYARKVNEYVRDTLKGFVADPADTDFQRGYLQALIDISDYMDAALPTE